MAGEAQPPPYPVTGAGVQPAQVTLTGEAQMPEHQKAMYLPPAGQALQVKVPVLPVATTGARAQRAEAVARPPAEEVQPKKAMTTVNQEVLTHLAITGTERLQNPSTTVVPDQVPTGEVRVRQAVQERILHLQETVPRIAGQKAETTTADRAATARPGVLLQAPPLLIVGQAILLHVPALLTQDQAGQVRAQDPIPAIHGRVDQAPRVPVTHDQAGLVQVAAVVQATLEVLPPVVALQVPVRVHRHQVVLQAGVEDR